MVKCWKCDGTGTTKGWISEPCAYCGGTGELPDDFSEMTKLKRCKKCGGEAVFSGVFDDPPTYRFPECMKCGTRAEGNNVKDSWYERARKWNEQNTKTNEEWRKTCSTEEFADFLAGVAHAGAYEVRNCNTNGMLQTQNTDFWLVWLKEKHDGV